MTTFSIEDFATECKLAMRGAANPEQAARECLEALLQDGDPAEVIEALEAAIPAGADVGEMIVHASPDLTMLYARIPARFESGIHNHTVFACIGQLEGCEVSTIYETSDDKARLAVAGTLTARAGEVISLPADAIHHIENPDATTARSLHLYGGDFGALMDERSLWDTDDHAEKAFNFQELLKQSIKTMKAHENRVGLEAVAEAIPATRSLIDAADTDASGAPEIVDEVLLSQSLQAVEGKDVIVDRVSLPPNTTLARRWHPGEMFVYVLDGAIVVARDGEAETVGSTGELIGIPLRQVYSARTNGEGAEFVIFRVHDSGQPMRTIVE